MVQRRFVQNILKGQLGPMHCRPAMPDPIAAAKMLIAALSVICLNTHLAFRHGGFNAAHGKHKRSLFKFRVLDCMQRALLLLNLVTLGRFHVWNASDANEHHI